MSEIYEHFPDAGSKTVDDTAQYISNYLSNEASKVKAKKLQSQNKSRTVDKRKTRSSTSGCEIDCDQKVKQAAVNGKNKPSDTTTETEHNDNELSETVLQALDDSMSLNDTLESTVTASFLDDTYDTETNTEDSITELKQIVNSQQNTNNESKRKERQKKSIATITSSENKKSEIMDNESEINCTGTCLDPENQSSIRCNMCMVWFHTVCVGISDDDAVGAWTCAGCRKLPEMVKEMKTQLGTLLQTTNDIMNTFKTFTENVDKKFENLNDRITAVVNQNKRSDETSTSSMTDIRQDIKTLSTCIDKKTNTVLSKTQTILDHVKNTTDLVSKTNGNYSCTSTLAKQTNNTSVKNTQNRANGRGHLDKSTKESNVSTPASKGSNPIDEIITINDDEANVTPTTTDSQPHQQKRDLTLITGSCILKTVETRFLSKNTRVKSFFRVKLETLEERLSNMDLSRYESIVLHVGGHDIDAGVNQHHFKQKYESLLRSLSAHNCKLVISGLLPRRRIDMRPFNTILKELSTTFGASYIDNHDSFILASGELPFEYYQSDKVNLKFPGTRLLIQNINKSCVILPKISNTNEQRNAPKFCGSKTHRSNRRNTPSLFFH